MTGASASLTVEPTGLHGSFSGAVAFAAPGISLGANLTVDLDTRPATRHVTVSGPDVSVTVAGQSLRAAVSFESTTTAAGQRVVRAAIANVGPNPLLTLGTPGSQVSVTTASGQLLLTGTGVALGLTATVAVTLPGITLTPGTVRVEVNTLTAPVAETFTVAGSPVTLSLPAGPYLRVSLTGASLALTTVPGTPTLSGSFAFEQRGQRTIIAATDVEVAVSIGTTAARLTQGQGVFVLVGASGIAGYLSGKASVAAGGVQAGGDILLRVDTALNTAIDETVEVGGQTLNVKFPSSATAVYAVSLTGARLTIGDFVTIEGDVAFTNDTFAGDGLTLFVGRGPARLDTGELNPLATGVLMTNARIGLVRVGAGYALVASGTVSLVGVTGVTLTGTVTARVNTTGAALTRTLTIDGSAGPGIELAFTGPEVVKEFQAVGATLTVAGQSLTGTFAFSQVAGGDVTVAATGVAANLGGGAVTLSSGTAALLVSANGIAGRITGTLNVSVPGLTLGSGFTVVLNSSAAPVSRTFDVAGTTVALDVPAGPFVRVEATHMTIGLLGQSLTADLVIQRATGADGTAVTTVGLANVDLVLGSGGTGVRLTGGSGLLVAGTGGIAGRLSGTVAVTLPAGTSLTGDLTVAVNTGFGAVSTSLTVGSTTLTLALPAGPYLRFEGTGLVLTVLGQTLSGDVAFEKATDLGADGAIGGTGLNADTSVVRLAMTHVAIDLGGVLKVREGTALLLLTPAGLAGTVSGSVTLAVPQVSLTGTLAVQVNTTGAAVSTSFLVAGAAGPVSLALPKGPYLRLAGTGVVLTVLGQSLAADVVLTRTVDAAGASTVTVEVRNLDLRLGGTAASPVVSVSQATGGVGTLVLGPTGVVGSIAVDVAVALPNVTLTGGFAVQVNTTSVAALGVPAGPFVRVSGTGVHLNVLDQVLTGSFTVEQVTTTAGAKVVRVGISGASLVLLSGKVSVTDVSGLVVLSPAGVAASLAASLSVSLTGVAVSGTVTLDVNTTAAAVSSSLVVGGTTVSLALPAGPYLKVTGTGVTLTVAGQALRGDISVEKATSLGADKLLGTADDSTQLRIAAANVSAAFGDGTRDLLTLSNGSAVLLVTANGMAGQVSGTVALVGVPGVSLAGTLGVRIHDAGTGAVDETFVVGGVTTQLKFAAADPSLVVTGTGVTLTVAGQSLAGDVTVTKGTGSLTVAIANGALTLGTPSAPIVRATGINGSFTTSSAGFWGTLTGSLEVSVPDVSLSSSVDVSIDTRTTGDGVKLVATGTTLAVGGQTISATTLTFRRSGAGVVDVTVAGFTVTLGGLATLTGNGALRITPQGLAAALQVTSATFTLGSSVSMGLETGGSVVVQVNTSATPVTLTVGTDTVVVPGGPFFQVAVTGGFLQVTSGPRFTGSFVLAKGTKPGFGDTGTAFLGTTAVTAVATGDVDGDGKIDLLVGSGTGAALYLGTGANTFSGTSAATFSGTGNTVAVALADLDGDGRLDVVVARAGTSSTYRQTGRGPLTFSGATDLTTPSATSLAVGDVDGDGFADLVVGANGSTTKIFLNGGRAHSTLTTPVTATDTSLVVADRTGFNGTQTLVVGTETITPTVLTAASSGTGGTFTVTRGSSAVGHSAGETVVGPWRGMGTTATEVVAGGVSSATVAVVLADLDNDALTDLVLVNTGDGVTSAIYRNLGPSSAAVWQGFEAPGAIAGRTLDAGLGAGVATVGAAAGDLDGDGYADLVVVANGAAPRIFRSQRFTDSTWNGLSATGTALAGPAAAGRGVVVGDIDRDGTLDVVVATGTTPLMYLNKGRDNAGAWLGLRAGSPVSNATTDTAGRVLLVNTDGDTDLDLLLAGTTGIRIAANTPVPFTKLGLAGVSVTITPSAGDGSGSGASGIGMHDGQGGLVILSDGVAGTFSATVDSGSTSTLFSANISVAVRINSTQHAVDETVVVGDTVIPVVFSDSEKATSASAPWILVAGSGTVTFGPLEIIATGITFGSGDVTVTSANKLTVFLGQGPAFLSEGVLNPNAVGVYLTDVTGSYWGDTRTISLTGTLRVVGIDGVTITGTNVSVLYNPGTSPSHGVAAGMNIRGTLTLAVSGLSLTGSMGFTRTGTGPTAVTTLNLGSATGITSATPVTFGIGELNAGHRTLEVSVATGSLTFTPAGVYGSMSINVTAYTTAFSLTTGAGSLRVNTTTAAHDGIAAGSFRVQLGQTGSLAGISFAGQTLQGIFGFEQYLGTVSPGAPAGTQPPRIIRVFADEVLVQLGTVSGGVLTTGVEISHGTGVLVIAPTGLAGRLTGTVALRIPGDPLRIDGTLSVSVNTGAAAVRESVPVTGGSPLSIDLPGGPYLRIDGTAVSLLVGGQRLTGDFAFEKSVAAGGGTVVRVLARNVSAAFGDGTTPVVSVTGATGFFVISPATTGTGAKAGGFAGTLGGTVALTVPGVGLGLTGTFTLLVNTHPATDGAVDETMTLGLTLGTVTAAVLGDLTGDSRPELRGRHRGGHLPLRQRRHPRPVRLARAGARRRHPGAGAGARRPRRQRHRGPRGRRRLRQPALPQQRLRDPGQGHGHHLRQRRHGPRRRRGRRSRRQRRAGRRGHRAEALLQPGHQQHRRHLERSGRRHHRRGCHVDRDLADRPGRRRPRHRPPPRPGRRWWQRRRRALPRWSRWHLHRLHRRRRPGHHRQHRPHAHRRQRRRLARHRPLHRDRRRRRPQRRDERAPGHDPADRAHLDRLRHRRHHEPHRRRRRRRAG